MQVKVGAEENKGVEFSKKKRRLNNMNINYHCDDENKYSVTGYFRWHFLVFFFFFF
jgi:hypothetical protein